MSKYIGPSPLIATGESRSAALVETAFNDLSKAVNSIDADNFDDGNSFQIITNRSVHPGALSDTYRNGTVIYGEPACWLAIGRGGSTKSYKYSLSPVENIYTVDGCCVRVIADRDCTIHVDAQIQIEAIKTGNARHTYPASAGSVAADIASLDLTLLFELWSVPVGQRLPLGGAAMSSSTAALVDSAEIYKRLYMGAEDANTNEGQIVTKSQTSGFSVHLGAQDVIRIDDDSNGRSPVVTDYVVRLKPTFVSCVLALPTSASPAENAALVGANTVALTSLSSQDIVYAHIKSVSRYITARTYYYPKEGVTTPTLPWIPGH